MARGAETRQRILEAAVRVIRSQGLVRATTKEIARAAGVSEGSLYNHFANKEELFLCALGQLPSRFVDVIGGLGARPGQGSVREVLAEVATAAWAFYNDAIPMGASLFADPELLARQRALLTSVGAGPHRANAAVAAYLRAEQQLGRVRADADPDAAAYLLLGSIFQRAYWRQFLGEEDVEDIERFIEGVLQGLERMLLPGAD